MLTARWTKTSALLHGIASLRSAFMQNAPGSSATPQGFSPALTTSQTLEIARFTMIGGGVMHIRSVHIRTCKTFSDLIIQDLPATARLVVMIGPNGCGKSSVFDAFRIWLGLNAGVYRSSDKLYYHKNGLPALDWNELV